MGPLPTGPDRYGRQGRGHIANAARAPLRHVAGPVPDRELPDGLREQQRRPRPEARGPGRRPGSENDYLNRQDYNRFNAYKARSFEKGSAVIRAIYEIEQQQPQPDPVASARITAQLGDWYLLHEEHEMAEEAYRQALGELVELEDAQQHASAIFGEPTALPSLEGVRPLPESVPVEAANVLLEFSVTRRGRVVNLERVDDTEGNSGKVNRLMRQLRKTPFRPRFVDGEPVDTAKVVRAYVVNG